MGKVGLMYPVCQVEKDLAGSEVTAVLEATRSAQELSLTASLITGKVQLQLQ